MKFIIILLSVNITIIIPIFESVKMTITNIIKNKTNESSMIGFLAQIHD